MVVAAAPPDPSGNDRSLLVFELEANISRARLAADLAAANIPAAAIILRPDPNAPVTWALVEVVGYVADDDARLGALPGHPWVLGGYAEPVAPLAGGDA